MVYNIPVIKKRKKCRNMSLIVVKTLFELSIVLLLIYGFIHEKDVIEFENLLLDVIRIKIKLYKKHRQQKSK